MVLFPGLKKPSKGRREEGKKKGAAGGIEEGREGGRREGRKKRPVRHSEAMVLRFECEMAPTGSALSSLAQPLELF